MLKYLLFALIAFISFVSVKAETLVPGTIVHDGEIYTFPVPTKDTPRLVYIYGTMYECYYDGSFVIK